MARPSPQLLVRETRTIHHTMIQTKLRQVDTNDVNEWLLESDDLASSLKTIGLASDDVNTTDMPFHLRCAIRLHSEEDEEGIVPVGTFDSIPFFSLCKGLFLPLSGLNPTRASEWFGFQWAGSSLPASQTNPAIIESFLNKELGLSFVQKIACLLGDPFRGQKSMFRRDSLVRLLQSLSLQPRQELLNELTVAGDICVLFAKHASQIKLSPPLTASEVLESLRALPSLAANDRFELLRSLFVRCGKLESYFLSKLILRNAGFGFEYQGALLSAAIAKQFQVSQDAVEHAIRLTDPLRVASLLVEQGAAGLKSIQLQPLSPIRPALASGGVDSIASYPVWVERKYDGIRFLLHKSTDTTGAILCGAYTRNRKDWLELVPGLDRTLAAVPAHNSIIDGELFGTILDLDGPRPASVYEVYAMLQGEPVRPVNLKFAAFDLLYLNSMDLTSLPLQQRRQSLAAVLGPLVGQPTPIPVLLTEGQLAMNKEDVNRLFHHFRAQGYEGIIAKDLNGTYHIASRDPSWVKRKPEITLDLVITGGTMAVTSKENAGMFGSYVVSARLATPQGFTFEFIGDVAGLDVVRDRQIQTEVVQRGLLTGRKFERQSASGTRPGWEFLPQIVVTVRFEGVIRESGTGKLSLRDPKIMMIRSDKLPEEADTVQMVEQLYLNQNLA
jgi:DNA ligase 1